MCYCYAALAVFFVARPLMSSRPCPFHNPFAKMSNHNTPHPAVSHATQTSNFAQPYETPGGSQKSGNITHMFDVRRFPGSSYYASACGWITYQKHVRMERPILGISRRRRRLGLERERLENRWTKLVARGRGSIGFSFQFVAPYIYLLHGWPPTTPVQTISHVAGWPGASILQHHPTISNCLVCYVCCWLAPGQHPPPAPNHI